jgi:hypothetical protein
LKYDEIRITTRRETEICRQAIKKLEKLIADMEKKYCITSSEFLDDFDPNAVGHVEEKVRWYQNCLALECWKERLAEHKWIMELWVVTIQGYQPAYFIKKLNACIFS